jgi:hypothetical protein
MIASNAMRPDAGNCKLCVCFITFAGLGTPFGLGSITSNFANHHLYALGSLSDGK